MNFVTLADVLMDKYEIYEGNLMQYFSRIFMSARNLENPYHNFRHNFHVLWLCYNACVWTKEHVKELPRVWVRNLLIAAMFHDFDHSGRTGHDDLEIERAIRGLERHILPKDKKYFDGIAQFIRWTQFGPKGHVIPTNEIGCMEGRILRDADMGQALSDAWIQQVIMGLSAEMGMARLEVLKMQEKFLSGIKFESRWGQEVLAPLVPAKIQEAKDLLGMIELWT